LQLEPGDPLGFLLLVGSFSFYKNCGNRWVTSSESFSQRSPKAPACILLLCLATITIRLVMLPVHPVRARLSQNTLTSAGRYFRPGRLAFPPHPHSRELRNLLREFSTHLFLQLRRLQQAACRTRPNSLAIRDRVLSLHWRQCSAILWMLTAGSRHGGGGYFGALASHPFGNFTIDEQLLGRIGCRPRRA